MPVIRGDTSLGVTIRGLYEALLYIEATASDPPQRGRARAHRVALKAAYPQLLELTEVDLAQHLAEEDGEPIDA